MRKFLFLWVLLFSAQLSYGQLDKILPYAGFTYQVMSIELKPDPANNIPGSDRPVLLFYYGLSLGMDYIFLHSNDQFSLGINPTVNVGIPASGYLGQGFMGQAPVFVLARYGANSTPFNEQRFGLGAGGGMTYTYSVWKGSLSSGGVCPPVNRIDQGFFNPSAVLEATIKSRNSEYTFRFNWGFRKSTRKLETCDYLFNTKGFSIVYSF